MIAWASAHPVLAAWLCAGVFFAACAGVTALFLRLMRDTGQRASGERPAREVGYVDSSPSALMARIDASLAHEAETEAPGEMPEAQDDPGPLYSWSTGQFAAVMADDSPEVAS